MSLRRAKKYRTYAKLVMSISNLRILHAIVGALMTLQMCVSTFAQTTPPQIDQNAVDMDYFEKHIRPLLIEKCYECHSADGGLAEGELLLDSQPAMKRGGSRGAVVREAHDWEKSLLWQAVGYESSDLQMPPGGKLSDAELQHLRAWLIAGAPDPRTAPTTISSDLEKPDASNHWAFKKPHVEAPVPSADSDWPQDVIDEYVYMHLEKSGIKPNAIAPEETLVRRLYYDLTGLPPTKEAIEAYLNDSAFDKYARLVDQLVDSPAFGERMARHWMDVVRYADTKGYVFQEDRQYPKAYLYRDWLIKAFSEDMPYDQFVRYQIAADALDQDNSQGHQAAMGMLTLGRRFLNDKNDIADDRIDVVSRGLMGLSVACARCHDHKYDPVTMADYYSLHSAFVNSKEDNSEVAPLALTDKEEISKAHIFKRGNAHSRGDEIDKHFVKFISLSKPYPLERGSGRVDLADAITDPDNPLTARAFVNRVWGWMTGKPIVATPSDFGVRCPEPVYRNVLDQLAIDFVREGWSVKKLVRRIALSSTYRMSSDHNADSAAIDPANDLFWRAERRRMDFESMRDAMLATTSRIDPTVGGPSVKLFEKPFSNRRTIYAYIDRQDLPGVMRAFDFANPDTHVPIRMQTTVPQQGLFLLNSEFVFDLASSFAANIDAEATELETRIKLVFNRLLLREPSPSELAMSLQFFATAIQERQSRVEDVWTYGYGSWDAETVAITSFTPFTNFGDDRWRVSNVVPDPELGWCFLSRDGGHPDAAHERATMRRWTAPRSGKIRVRGNVKHPSDQGDGVLSFVCRDGQLISEKLIVANGEREIGLDEIEVEQGTVLSFVTDANGSINNDSFEMRLRVSYLDDKSAVFRSNAQFAGPVFNPATPMQQFVQALLICNEFCFVD